MEGMLKHTYALIHSESVVSAMIKADTQSNVPSARSMGVLTKKNTLYRV